MSRGYANFIRVFAILMAILNLVLLFFLETNTLIILVFLCSTGLLLVFALCYAKHIDKTLDHEEQLVLHGARLSELSQLLASLQAESSAPQNAGAARSNASDHLRAQTASGARAPAARLTPLPNDPEHGSCSACGDVQRVNRTRCKNCGAAFVKQAPSDGESGSR